MAALEVNRDHARKRKERRDSGSSHERKERKAVERSPSGERSNNPPAPLHDSNRLEVERRAERLSRTRRPQNNKRRKDAGKSNVVQARSPRSPKTRKENSPEKVDRSPSPVYRLDLDALHCQLGGSEPARSWGSWSEEESTLSRTAAIQSLSSSPHQPTSIAVPSGRTDPPPRSSLMATTLGVTSPPDKTLDKINKKVRIISVLKKSIAKIETDYEQNHGHPMTKADKMLDQELVKMIDELARLKAEKKCIKQDPAEYAVKVLAAKKQKEQDDKLDVALKSDKPMTDLVVDIEEWLSYCRASGGRNWTVACEKSAVQRALLRLEGSRGRPPPGSAARAAARPLYDAYRSVKRALQHQASVGNELTTILEHETMLFPVTSLDSSSEDKVTTSEEIENQSVIHQPTRKEAQIEEQPSSTSTSEETPSEETHHQTNESLHCMNLDQLSKILTETKIQKIELRKNIKNYESQNKLEYSKSLELDFERYKAVKAKIRLVTALITKKKSITP